MPGGKGSLQGVLLPETEAVTKRVHRQIFSGSNGQPFSDAKQLRRTDLLQIFSGSDGQPFSNSDIVSD